MNTPEQIARDIMGHLSFQIAKGWGAFCVAKHVHEAKVNKRINCAHYFFSITEEACLETAILTLSKIIVDNRDSVNIQYLLNFAKQNYQIFSRSDEQTITSYFNQHKQQLDNISPMIANVKEQRDRTIAHLDKKHVTNPSVLYSYSPLNYTEVENAFKLLLQIINTYSSLLTPSIETRLEHLSPSITEDLNYLVGLIEQDNARE